MDSRKSNWGATGEISLLSMLLYTNINRQYIQRKDDLTKPIHSNCAQLTVGITCDAFGWRPKSREDRFIHLFVLFLIETEDAYHKGWLLLFYGSSFSLCVYISFLDKRDVHTCIHVKLGMCWCTYLSWVTPKLKSLDEIVF